ncbi:MAG: hypothetical protein ABSD10_04170 [Candidatus Saccharimonadales bacterium]|jgi:hypothetical protein
MSQEETRVRKWPTEALGDRLSPRTANGYIDYLNEHGTDEEKRAYVHNRKKDALINSAVWAGVIGATIGSIQGLRETGIMHGPDQNTPIERTGSHHGSTTMPSTEHLNKFAAEHGINLNQE